MAPVVAKVGSFLTRFIDVVIKQSYRMLKKNSNRISIDWTDFKTSRYEDNNIFLWYGIEHVYNNK